MRSGGSATATAGRDTPPLLDIVVRGEPIGQGRLSNNRTGHAYYANHKKLLPWRDQMRSLAASEMFKRDLPPFDGPVIVDAVFTFARPASHFRTGKNAHLLRDSAPLFPISRPDLSHLIRAAEDALTSIVITDDSRIVDYGTVGKRYPNVGVDALPYPGAIIRVWPVV